MIIDKRSLPDDPTPSDAPPSYESTSEQYPPEKPNKLFGYSVNAPLPEIPSDDTPFAGPSSPSTSKRDSYPSPSPTSPRNDAKGKARAGNNWFNFAANRTNREVRTTVLGLVRDLVQEHISGTPAAFGILKSCADACSAHDVSLSEILQSKFIEDRTPFYWAIVKRLPDGHHDVEESQGPDLISALISYAHPLKQETIREIRLACLATSDQKLFQRLRLSPEFHEVSGVEQMLLGVKSPLDEIEVEDVSPDGGAFAMDFVIPYFHKRMVVAKEIPLEFIARGRMWKLAFYIVPQMRFQEVAEGTWCVSISLMENSPPTFIDSQIIIHPWSEPSQSPIPAPSSLLSPSDSPPSSSNPPPSPFSQISNAFRPPRPPKVDSIVSLRLKTAYEQLEVGRGSGKKVFVVLDQNPIAGKLQYSNNPYVGPDEKLRGRLEARLGKPEGDCIVC